MDLQTIYTIEAKCQDCYRCLRVCPVKAISVRRGQAQVQDKLCIKCGLCVRECPQEAKVIRSDWADVKSAAEMFSLVASVAPSFAAVYGGKLANRLPSALRALGFKHICETAEGAMYITEKSFAPNSVGSICTACPAIVSYVEMYKTELIDRLIPVVSPIIAHGRMLKERYPDCRVVFIGPCSAKKAEIKRPENVGAIDYAITFAELNKWLESDRVKVENCPETDFDNKREIGYARLFPIQGGMLKTGEKSDGGIDADVLHLSGVKNIQDLFSDKEELSRYKYIEPLFCDGGCINGPGFKEETSVYAKRSQVLNYSQNARVGASAEKFEVGFAASFNKAEVDKPHVSEKEINAVFEKTGKADPAARLDCGACGYPTCVEKAKAVVLDMAEADMCLPYMRRLAKRRIDKIIEKDPNGIVILDENLNILSMNPAFRKMFMCSDGLIGRNISHLLVSTNYEELTKGKIDSFESVRIKNNRCYYETTFALREDLQYVGVYSDLSNLEIDKKYIERIKIETLMHAEEFLEHQVSFAQEMAHYLGKSTAQGETIARRLIELYKEESDSW